MMFGISIVFFYIFGILHCGSTLKLLLVVVVLVDFRLDVVDILQNFLNDRLFAGANGTVHISQFDAGISIDFGSYTFAGTHVLEEEKENKKEGLFKTSFHLFINTNFDNGMILKE